VATAVSTIPERAEWRPMENQVNQNWNESAWFEQWLILAQTRD
jgi:hypothetical protein